MWPWPLGAPTPTVNMKNCYIAWVLPATALSFIGYFTVTWALTIKLFPAKCHERVTLQKLSRQTGNSSPSPANCWPLLHAIRGSLMCCRWNLNALFKICFCFVLLYAFKSSLRGLSFYFRYKWSTDRFKVKTKERLVNDQGASFVCPVEVFSWVPRAYFSR